jgi:antitoxin component of MazEF toxin-antitoxin module
MAEILETIVRDNTPLDVPRELRAMLHLRTGDRIRWSYQNDRIVAEEVKKKKGALSSLVGKFSGDSTDSVASHNLTGMP